MNNERIVISFKYMFKVNVMKLRNPPEISFPNVSDIPAYLQCSLDLYIIYLSEEKKNPYGKKKSNSRAINAVSGSDAEENKIHQEFLINDSRRDYVRLVKK